MGFGGFMCLHLSLGCQFSTFFEDTAHTGDTFYNRAKALRRFSMLDVGNLQIVQAFLLMAYYLHGHNRPNRRWNAVGLGIRVALGLGPHIERNGEE